MFLLQCSEIFKCLLGFFFFYPYRSQHEDTIVIVQKVATLIAVNIVGIFHARGKYNNEAVNFLFSKEIPPFGGFSWSQNLERLSDDLRHDACPDVVHGTPWPQHRGSFVRTGRTKDGRVKQLF